jgi:hypothetical protein
VYAKICLAIAIPVHIDAQDGSLLTLDIDVVGAEMLRGCLSPSTMTTGPSLASRSGNL